MALTAVDTFTNNLDNQKLNTNGLDCETLTHNEYLTTQIIPLIIRINYKVLSMGVRRTEFDPFIQNCQSFS